MTKEEYLKDRCEIFECTPKEYMKNMKSNYVIVDSDNIPFSYEDDGDVVVYYYKKDALSECLADERVITEQEFFNTLK